MSLDLTDPFQLAKALALLQALPAGQTLSGLGGNAATHLSAALAAEAAAATALLTLKARSDAAALRLSTSIAAAQAAGTAAIWLAPYQQLVSALITYAADISGAATAQPGPAATLAQGAQALQAQIVAAASLAISQGTAAQRQIEALTSLSLQAVKALKAAAVAYVTAQGAVATAQGALDAVSGAVVVQGALIAAGVAPSQYAAVDLSEVYRLVNGRPYGA